MTSASATVLFVCTGNVCRSPYLERRFRAALAVRGMNSIVAASAGTGALTGHAIGEPLAIRLHRSGLDPAHSARQLTPADVRDAALILTATREHRRLIARMDVASAARTFTARQFVRLLRVTPADSVVSLETAISAANGARGRAGASTSDDDIEDPWRRSRRVYTRVAQTMDEVVDELVDHLIS